LRNWRRSLKAGDRRDRIHFVDSNVFFYAKIMDPEYGPACARVLQRIHDGHLTGVTSTLVTLEVANALRKFGLAQEVRDTLDSIFSLPLQVFDLQYSDLRNAVEIFQTYPISPYDCAHVAVMRRATTKSIISADRDFDKIREIERRDPKTID
jgi:predicted nucleic acid-binding protein